MKLVLILAMCLLIGFVLANVPALTPYHQPIALTVAILVGLTYRHW